MGRLTVVILKFLNISVTLFIVVTCDCVRIEI